MAQRQTSAAAKRKKLFILAAVWALLSALLAPTPALATRTLPANPGPTLAPQLPQLEALGADLDAGDAFPLLGPEDRLVFATLTLLDHDQVDAVVARQRHELHLLSADLARAREAARALKTATGVSISLRADKHLEWRDLRPESHRQSYQGLWTDPTTGLSYARNRWYDARTASWLSEDPLGPVDSPNLYAFVEWGPHMGADPMGLYSKDFHLYGVYFLARCAGFNRADALDIAWASQYVDDYSATNPGSNLWYLGMDVIDDRLKTIHFVSDDPSGVVRPGNVVATTNVENAVHTDDLLELGASLHIYADTFSHQGFVGGYDPVHNRADAAPRIVPPFAHAEALHEPDEPWRNTGAAMSAARGTYEYLRTAARRQGIQRAPKEWEEINFMLAHLFLYVGTEEERSEQWNQLIASEFPGERPWISGRIDYEMENSKPNRKAKAERAIDRQRSAIREHLRSLGVIVD